jgi:hypothetical protein
MTAPLDTINSPCLRGEVFIASIAAPGGGRDLYLSPDEAARFDADPDLFAAKYFELAKAEYREWIETDGTPFCGGETRLRRPCRARVGRPQQNPCDWKRLHRACLCRAHDGRASYV